MYRQPKAYEEYVIVLDYLPYGYYTPRGFIRGPLAQAVGEDYFMLLELQPYEGIPLSIRERVYVGKHDISKVRRITRRLTYDELTQTAKGELPEVIEEIVTRKAEKFVEFFNKASPLTTRMHSLELLRGVGKKTLWKILEERKKRPFESFKDIQERTRISDPKRLIVERILEEIKGGQKYYLFVVPPPVRKRF
ncbi:MAG: DUF655 domain-containing protein [Thermoprotei archaeon]|nr:MAG: DUF655 domain-containing protein [Thermoprotei archaeon]